MNSIDKSSATREIFWNIPTPYNQVLMYGAFAVSMVIAFWGLYRRYELWVAGTAAQERLGNWGERMMAFWDGVVRQRGTNREPAPRLFHSLILWGFIILLFTTTMVFLENDLGIPVFRGRFYLAVTVLSDIFGFLFLVGILLAFHRRFVTHPDQLHSAKADWFMLGLLALMIVQGFGLEALRIAATNDPWRAYSPVGDLLSRVFWPLSARVMAPVHFVLWWFHALTVFVFFALLPYTKFFHILSSSTNLFFRELHRPKGAMKYPGDIETIIEQASDTGEFKIGAQTLEDLTWKERLDLDACTSCGRCQNECPAYNSGKPLSPKWLILDTRNHMLSLQAKAGAKSTRTGFFGLLDKIDAYLLQRFLLDDQNVITTPPPADSTSLRPPLADKFLSFRGENEAVQRSFKVIGGSASAALAGEVMEENVFWSCTTCRACMEVCPVGIEHLDHIFDVRRSMALMEGRIPSEAQASLRSIETRGNPFGDPQARASWSDGLNVRILEAGDEVDVLYWVGCISAYDRRKQNIARSMVRILESSGYTWGILGNKESCTGDPARRLGEENLFQTLAKQNAATLATVKFTTLIANCPHCFNTLKNEYPDVDAAYRERRIRVIHHTHFIRELIDLKRITLTGNSLGDVTFHDPCYLGRYNDTYDEPRETLVQLGGKLSEMKSYGKKSMCCGAGGGHFWMDIKQGERINVLRVNQAAETNAPVIAAGCPFCVQMLEDGVKLTEREESIQVRDIAELVAERLASNHAATEPHHHGDSHA